MPRWQRGKHAVLEESKDALYGVFVEFGTHTRYRSGIMRKGTKQPFLRPALESQARAAIERFKDMAGRKIEKAAQRIGRKRGA